MNTYYPSGIVDYTNDPISCVRFLIGDTDTTVAQISDDEITALRSDTPTGDTDKVRVIKTAIRALEFVITKYEAEPSFNSGGTSVDMPKAVEGMRRRIGKLNALLYAETSAGSYIFTGRDATFSFPSEGLYDSW